MNPPQEVEDLQQRSAALMSTIPFRSDHRLAEPMFQAQLVPFPGEDSAGNSTGDEAQAPGQDVQDDGQAAAPTTRSFGGDLDGRDIASNEDGDVTPGTDLLQEGGDSDVNVGLVVGPVAAAVVVVILGVLAAVFVQKRRAKQRKHTAMAGAGAYGHQVC